MATLVSYADVTGAPAIAVNVIKRWKSAPEMVMSASSGPKDYVKNDVAALFNSDPDVVEVVMVRGGGPIFFLRRLVSGIWIDATRRPVKFATGE
jgi:hypothetical protein